MKIRVLHPKIVQQFEENAQFQGRLHLTASYFWLANFPVVAYLFFFQAGEWMKIGLVLNTFYSLWANFATDYGALSAAQASQKADNKEPAPTSEPTPPWLWPQK